MLRPEKELRELPDDNPNIFLKKKNIDCYTKRPTATPNKSNKTCKYQRDEFNDNRIGNGREECS